jgi:hypothetical protein
MSSSWARFALFAAILATAAVVIAFFDPFISHTLTGIGYAAVATFTNAAHNITAIILNAHPLEVVLGTAFAIDPLDRVMTLAEWRAKNRISASTERRMRKAGLGPRLVNISAGLLGVRVRDDLEWMERGGASGASASPPTRNTGRDTRAATAASLKKRAERKAAAPPTAAEPSPQHTTAESVDATA